MSTAKMLQSILQGRGEGNLRFDEVCALLEAKGFRMRVAGVAERINIQKEGGMAKPYQIRQIRKILLQYKLT